MVHLISQWITATNQRFAHQRLPCSRFSGPFAGFYSPEFLATSYYVVTEQLPKPDYPELRAAGFSDFIDMPAGAITYLDTYYITPAAMASLRTHFHELVHVQQWLQLGQEGFIARYMAELGQHGYDQAPLERMAYEFDGHFDARGAALSVAQFVAKNL